MSAASNFYKGLSDVIDNAIQRVTPFRARADQIVDGKVKIQTLDGSDPLDEPFARLAGSPIEPDDEIAVINLSGKPFVLGRIVRTDEGGANTGDGAFLVPVSIQANDSAALAVRDGDGVTRFRVDTDGYKVISIDNDTAMEGWGSDAENKWYIGATGNAYFSSTLDVDGNLTAPLINGVVPNQIHVTHHTDAAPTVASTTSVGTWHRQGEWTTTLPDGEWMVDVLAVGRLAQSAEGSMSFRAAVATTYGTEVSGGAVGNSPYFGTVRANGQSGSVNIRCEFKQNASGTAYAGASSLFVVATRTG